MLRSSSALEASIFLEDNNKVTERCLAQLTTRLKRTDNLIHEYDATVCNYPESGMAELVSEAETKKCVYYMSNQTVICESSTTMKLRVAFDASSDVKKAQLLKVH